MLIDIVNEVVGGPSFFPNNITASGGGAGVDLANGEVSTQAILMVGAVSGTTPTLNIQMQESNDNATWTSITGAVFNQVTAGNQEQRIRFLRTKRYCQAYATMGGTTPSFDVAVEILAQAKYVGQGGGFDLSPA